MLFTMQEFIKTLLTKGFLPPPYPLQHSVVKQLNHVERVNLVDNFIPKQKEGVKLNFAPLTVKLSFQITSLNEELPFIPWNYCCVSIQKIINKS